MRVENLEELVGVAREYDANDDEPSLEEFLQQIALVSEQDKLQDEQGPNRSPTPTRLKGHALSHTQPGPRPPPPYVHAPHTWVW